MKFKKFLVYLLFLLPWFISSLLFKIDKAYYLSLNKPFFAPNPIIFGIVWPILYILISYSVYKTWKDKNNKYVIYLIINYIANQLFTWAFFSVKNNFLALIDTIIILVSSIFLYFESKMLKSNYSKYLIPYIIWNVFALILIFTIFLTN